jgi:ribosomal protein S12 methylthiotransferase
VSLTYHIISLGCSKNQVDSERLNAALIENGFVQSEDIESSDFVVINTCGFIQSAKEESIAVILDSLELKLSGAKIAVLGCLSERYKKDILADIPEIDLVYGLYDDGFIPAVKSLFAITEKFIQTTHSS